jgi:hypothetical protein
MESTHPLGSQSFVVTVFFIPEHSRSNLAQFIPGIPRAFFVLGWMTPVSTSVFLNLKKGTTTG